MHVLATAGHVDHGKSTLVRALTGMEPDRWEAEQRRGMTIDLGYAWTTLPDGGIVAFVDVPGHERFVPNMLAGVGPVPAVLFVVAADQGWSAQSTEHLAALQALGVENGVLAVTRSDLGDPELAEAEAREHLADSGLANIEAVAVSAVSGAGLDQLRQALMRMVARLPTTVESATRLWVDRVFTVRGAGTVVTGTLSSGSLRVEDSVTVFPSARVATIRGLECLQLKVEEAHAPSRVALNLRGVRPEEVRRGHAIVSPDDWQPVTLIDVRVSTSTDDLARQIMVHVGSAAVSATVRPLANDLARLRLTAPLPLHVGERLLLRDPGRRAVIGGATVLDTFPPPLVGRGAAARRAAELANLTGQRDVAVEVGRRRAVRIRDLRTAGISPVADTALADVVEVGEWIVAAPEWNRWREELKTGVDRWAKENPIRPGMPRRAAADALELPDPALIDSLVASSSELVIDATGVHRTGITARLPAAAEQAVQRLLARLDADPFDAAEVVELAEAGLTETLLAVAVGDGRLLRIEAGVYLRADAIEQALARLATLSAPFSVSTARQTWKTTRRVALPLLEHLDRLGRTRRLDATFRVLT